MFAQLELNCLAIRNTVWKLLKMSYLKFFNFDIFQQFLVYKNDLSGNTVWLQASWLKNSPKLTIFSIFD